MVAQIKAQQPVIINRDPKNQSGAIHPLARFVTRETVAFLFNIKIEDIRRIECWPHVVYVHAVGVSRFVSYADFPPIVGTQPPEEKEYHWWLRRWRKAYHCGQAPDKWIRFYCQQFAKCTDVADLWQWGKLIAQFKLLFSLAALETLRSIYQEEKYCCENF